MKLFATNVGTSFVSSFELVFLNGQSIPFGMIVWSSVYSTFGFSVIKSATPLAGTELSMFWCKIKGTRREKNNYPKMLRATHLDSLILNNATSSFPKWRKGEHERKDKHSALECTCFALLSDVFCLCRHVTIH